MTKQQKRDKYLGIFEKIDWDNYSKKSDSTGKVKFWKLPEVLYCKLDYVLECAELDDEQSDTIVLIQELMELLREKDINSIFKL